MMGNVNFTRPFQEGLRSLSKTTKYLAREKMSLFNNTLNGILCYDTSQN
jgi:hypothetical protein